MLGQKLRASAGVGISCLLNAAMTTPLLRETALNLVGDILHINNEAFIKIHPLHRKVYRIPKAIFS